MKSSTKTATITMASVLAIGLMAASGSALAAKEGFEKCQGVAKAKMNDCATKKHACAGTSKMDRQASDWIYVPTGTCNKIAGGKVKA